MCDLILCTLLTEHGELILFQLPDTLPGEPPEPAEAQGGRSDAQTDARNARLSSLKDFSDGYIGKLQVHASGKTRLVLGNVALDITTGTPTGFLQVCTAL